jgi:hypothetical protein
MLEERKKERKREKDITKSLAYEQAIKQYAAKNLGKGHYRGVSGT